MDDCIFCRMVKKEINPDIVYEDEDVLAFNDIQPKAPVHVLVIPKQHLATFNDIQDHQISGKIAAAIQKIVKDKGLEQSGYRIVVNCNQAAGQVIFHLHYHLLGGRILNSYPD